MGAGLRRVRRLRLRSANESLNRRGAILIEDALRTASLPDADASRMLIIRSLSLGAIRASDPPSSIAMRIEARCRQLGIRALHAGSATAVSADAVYFNDELEPYVTLALKIARGEQPSEWFWPMAIRSWSPALTCDEAMRAIMGGALASSAGPAAALVLVRYLIRLGAIGPLLGAIRGQDGPFLIRAFGWPLPDSPRERASTMLGAVNGPSALFAQVARPWFIDWGKADARSFWLACAMLSIERPAFATNPDLPIRATEFIEAVLEREFETAAENRSHRSALKFHDTPDSSPAHEIGGGNSPLSVEVPAGAETQRAQSVQSSNAGVRSSLADDVRPSERKFTMCGGLFFLVAAMERLGIARWLERHPEAREFGLPSLVLRTVALDLGASPDDPALAALDPAVDDVPQSLRAMAHSWIRWIRRYLRRNVRIALAPLVSRPARIAFTDIHIDVMSRFDRADIRVRRAGLDIDPGWTPWLGRVIRFRYAGDDVYDA